jgi:hypothetical protein
MQLAPRADVELGKDPVQVGSDGAMGQEESIADLPVGQTLGRELGDLKFLRGEQGPGRPFRLRGNGARCGQLGGGSLRPGGGADLREDGERAGQRTA